MLIAIEVGARYRHAQPVRARDTGARWQATKPNDLQDNRIRWGTATERDIQRQTAWDDVPNKDLLKHLSWSTAIVYDASSIALPWNQVPEKDANPTHTLGPQHPAA